MRKFCPICNAQIVPSHGHGDILIIGDAPDREDLTQGIPFAFNPNYMTTGRILRKEMELVGVSQNQFRLAHLWQHTPNKSEECFRLGYDAVLDEAKGKKAILLIGSDVVETFTEYKVSDVSGLQVTSSVLSAPIIYAMTSPALAMHRALGEVRHGVQKFIIRLEKEGLV
jgi:uracil-DNA glycosylase